MLRPVIRPIDVAIYWFPIKGINIQLCMKKRKFKLKKIKLFNFFEEKIEVHLYGHRSLKRHQ